MRYVFLAGVLALLMATTAMAEDKLRPLFDFTEADAAKQWQTVNDGVMGGVSEGKFKITDAKTMEFFGTLSLARIFHEYLIRKHINNLLCNQSVFLLETLFCAKLPPDPHLQEPLFFRFSQLL